MAPNPNRRQQEQSRQRAQAATAARQKKARRRRQIIAGIVAAVVILSTVGALLGSRKSTTTSPTTTSSTVTTLPTNGVATPEVAPGATLTGATPCPAEDGSSARTTMFASAPPTCIDPTFFYTATITTSIGPLTIQLNPRVSPNTVNAFVVLAGYHYYDGQPVTSITPRAAFSIGMSFSGTGPKAPGFEIPGESPPSGTVFTPGALAMAMAASSGGVGGQLVVATYELAAGNDQSVTPLGIMLSGDATLNAINAQATESSQPGTVITISTISVTRSGAIPR